MQPTATLATIMWLLALAPSVALADALQETESSSELRLILASGLHAPLVTSARGRDPEFLFTADVGFRTGGAGPDSWGGVFHVAADGNGSRWGIGPRYRRQLDEGIALDATLGILVSGSDNQVAPKYPGGFGSISVLFSGLVSVDLGFDVFAFDTRENFPDTPSGTAASIYLGGSLQSYLAPAVPIALLVVAMAAMSSSNY